MNLALINGISLVKCSSMVNLNIDTSFVRIDALRAEILNVNSKVGVTDDKIQDYCVVPTK